MEDFKLDFLGLGTFRAGTTWLHHMLSQHPQIFLPEEKELFYFTDFYYRGLDWYKSFYKKVLPDQKKGEICPAYLSSLDAPKRIRKLFDNLKFIVILRNPYTQIISMYKHHYKRGVESKNFHEAVLKNPFYIHVISYAGHLKRYFSFFDRNNFLILKYESIQENKKFFLKKIYNFLEIKEFYPKNLEMKVNSSNIGRLLIIDKVIAKTGDFLRKKNLYVVKKIIEKSGMLFLIKKINESEKNNFNLKIEDFPKEFILTINKEIDKLEELLMQDFSQWKV